MRYLAYIWREGNQASKFKIEVVKKDPICVLVQIHGGIPESCPRGNGCLGRRDLHFDRGDDKNRYVIHAELMLRKRLKMRQELLIRKRQQ